MSDSRPAPPSDPRAVSRLFGALLAEAWDALGPYRLDDADRDDLAQEVVIVAYQRWHTYREDAGTPRQWIRSIARNEVLAFYRRRGKAPLSVGGEEQLGAADVPNVEEAVSADELTERLLAEVPPRQRWFVILHQVLGLTLREIAKLEGISLTRTHVHYRAGMKALQAAAGRWEKEQERRGLAPLPLTIMALFEVHRAMAPPPPDVVEHRWQRVALEIGLDAKIGEEPPDSGPRALRKGRLFEWTVLGVLGGALLSWCAPAREHGRSTVSPPEAPAVMASGIVPASPPSSSAPQAIAEGAVLRAEIGDGQRRAEQTRGNAGGARAALAAHAPRLFHERHAASRQTLWTAACTKSGDDRGAPDPGCTAKR